VFKQKRPPTTVITTVRFVMTRPVQFAIALGLMIGFLLPRETTAQCLGNPSSNYPPVWQTIPSVIRLVGQSFGTPDPYGACTMTIRDATNNPAPNVPVTIDFFNCPDVRICNAQEPGTTVVCTGFNRSVTRNTDATGHVTFTIVGRGINPGCSGSAVPCARVFICGSTTPVKTIIAAAYDQDGIDGVTLIDVSRVYGDVNCGHYYARSDFDGNGVVNLVDVSNVYGVVNGNQSPQSCGSFCP